MLTATEPMKANIAEHRLVYSDPYSYCAHAHAVTTADGTIIAVFNRAPRRRAILHPPQDPAFENVMTRSSDGARNWSAPVGPAYYGWSGLQADRATRTSGRRLLLKPVR